MDATDSPLNLKDVFYLSCPCDRHIGYWLQRRGNVDIDLFLAYKRAEKRPRKAVEMRIEAGGRFTDFLGNGTRQIIVSKRVVDCFRKYNIRGWRSYRVQIFDKKGEPLDNEVCGLAIFGRAGPQDLTRGHVKINRRSDGSVSVRGRKALYFDTNKWDGNDVFLLEDANYFLVTRRVIEVLKAERLTGWEVEPVLKLSF